MSELDEFQAFAARNAARSSAQLAQDLWVLWATQERRDLYFVEVGAADGAYLSNTLLLERDYAWQGIVAEPVPSWHQALRRNRRCHVDTRCVCGQTGGQVSLLTSEERPDLSALAEVAFDDMHGAVRRSFMQRVQAESVSLQDLLDEHGAPQVLDYLSIDTEGSELAILEAFDLRKRCVRLLSVEHNYHAERRQRMQQLLERQGYMRCFEAISQWDDWYRLG